MQKGESYIRDLRHFLEKVKNVNNLWENAMLVKADKLDLYPNIPHQSVLTALKGRTILTNNYLKINNKVFQEISGAAIDTKFLPSIYMHLYG